MRFRTPKIWSNDLMSPCRKFQYLYFFHQSKMTNSENSFLGFLLILMYFSKNINTKGFFILALSFTHNHSSYKWLDINQGKRKQKNLRVPASALELYSKSSRCHESIFFRDLDRPRKVKFPPLCPHRILKIYGPSGLAMLSRWVIWSVEYFLFSKRVKKIISGLWPCDCLRKGISDCLYFCLSVLLPQIMGCEYRVDSTSNHVCIVHHTAWLYGGGYIPALVSLREGLSVRPSVRVCSPVRFRSRKW